MRICLVLLVLFAVIRAYGQPIHQGSYNKKVQTAKLAMEKYDYAQAIEKFEVAYEDGDKPDSLLPYMADLYFKTRDYGRAARYYRRVLRKDKTGQYNHLYYDYGRALKMDDKYDDAEEAFIEFLAYNDNDSLETLARAELEGIRMAPNMPEKSRGVELENIGRDVNSKQSEYSPILNPQEKLLYFVAFDTDDPVAMLEDGVAEFPARVFTTTKEEEGDDWQEPAPLTTKVNREDEHVFNVTISPAGDRLYYTRGLIQGMELLSSRMYFSEGRGTSWSGAQEVQGINGDYIVKNPTVGELFGREVLIFASDMPGGYGGFDLYYATRTGEGEYADPVNLGKVINTLGDDETPYYLDGTLYFSSTGHPGLGGFDIFFSVWDGSNWSEPQNMGKGFNSPENDLYFTMDASGYNGFMVSNRAGQGNRSLQNRTCCYDIYTYSIPEVYIDLVAGIFSEAKKPIKGGTVALYTMENDVPGSPQRKNNPKGNRFDFELAKEMPYMVVASAPDYYPDTATLNTVGIRESKTFEQRFFLKAKPKPAPEPEFDTIAMEEAIVLENILYDFDSDRILREAESDLEVVYELMAEYPEMKIELSAHTDNRGDDNYNMDLSQRRAESARRWLVRKEVPRRRIEAKGYGETRPYTVTARTAAQYDFLKEGDVLTGSFINELKSKEQQEVAHNLNRRTEFKILEGPKTITIKRTRLKKKESGQAPGRNKQYRKESSFSPQAASGTLQISPLSSLYGLKSLQGLPVMVFEEREVDFGTVKQGEKRRHTFTFTNKGDVPVEIDLVSACECTTVDYPRQPVKPGTKGAIDVVFDSAEKEEAEEIVIDIFLETEHPQGGPIFEQLKYTFDIED